MSIQKQILQEARKNNGIITSKKIDQLDIARAHLKYLCDVGKLERVARGVYALPEAWQDQLYNLQIRFTKGIYSAETVLYLAGLSDKTPQYYTMVFPQNYNLKKPKSEGLICFQEKRDYYQEGITEYQTAQGNVVKGYIIEKVLCDILKPRYKTDVAVISDAYKLYIRQPRKNIALLSKYAQKARVVDRVRSYLEVLL